MKYYGSGYGVGSVKFGRKVFSMTGMFNKKDTCLWLSVGRVESIICGVYDYGITVGGFGLSFSLGWFISDCGVWQEGDMDDVYRS